MTIEVDFFILLKFLGGLLAAVAFIFLIYRAYRGIASWFHGREYEFDKDGIKKRWQEIENLLKESGEMNYKMAVLEADKLLDQVLKSMAMPGKDFAERLRFAAFKYQRLKNVWWAHGVRNRLAHEPTFSLGRGLAKRAVAQFKKALEEVGAI